MDRLQQKHSLYIKLGTLFGPLIRLAEKPDQYDEQEKAETLAQYFDEYPRLATEFQTFSPGQPGHNYVIEYQHFYFALDGVRQELFGGTLGTVASLGKIVREQLAKAQTALDAVPIPRTSVILEAGNPFTTYCKLKELCEVDATKSLIWLDPYHGASVFHRYIASVRLSVPVTLVASEPDSHASGKDKNRWTEFLDISRLYAQERGTALYRLVIQPNLHDRWIVFDEKRIYALGGSAKDAGDKDYFTITSIEASTENLQRIKSHIDTGTELFGPTSPKHN